VLGGVQKHQEKIAAHFIATYVVRNACVSPQEHLVIKKNVRAITTGDLAKALPNVLKITAPQWFTGYLVTANLMFRRKY